MANLMNPCYTRKYTAGETTIVSANTAYAKTALLDTITVKPGDGTKMTVKDGTTTIWEGYLSDEQTYMGRPSKPYTLNFKGCEIVSDLKVTLTCPAATRHYKFDDDINTPSATVTDYGSDDTDGTLANCETADRVIGKIGMGISLDGVDEQLNTTDVLTTTGNDAFSVAMWGYRAADDVYHYLFYQYEDTYNLMYCAIIGTGRLYFVARRLNAYLDLEGTEGDISKDAWHHLCLTYDGSLTCAGFHFYLDGNPVNLKSKREDMVDGLTWSETATNIGKTWNGKIDDFRHYDCELTPQQVKLLYNNGYGTEDDFECADVLISYRK
jgi:hypothetical protein